MSELVARTGRHQQRYDSGCRLVAGCVPFKYRSSDENDYGASEKVVEVLMINSNSGPGLLFPKALKIAEADFTPIYGENMLYLHASFPQGTGGWENDETVEEAAAREALEEAGVRGDLMHFLGHYEFKSKTLQDEFSPEGLCKAAMFALLVKEELQSWPEQNTRHRSWLTIPEARGCCRYKWMEDALEKGFIKWHNEQMINTLREENHVNSPPSCSEKD